jgi:hypothetical protein
MPVLSGIKEPRRVATVESAGIQASLTRRTFMTNCVPGVETLG